MAGHGHDVDWAALGPALEHGAEVLAPLHAAAVRWVCESTGGHRDEVRLVVDVGSGPGVITCLLAAAFPAARVIAIDGSPELLHRARRRAEREGIADRFEARVADLPDGLDELVVNGVHHADVVWTSQVMHHLGDQQDGARRVSRLLRPGGLFAVVEGGLPMRALPRDIGLGRPGLEARLDVANEAWFADLRAALPNATPAVEHWPGLLAGAGLAPAGSATFLLDLPTPLGDDGRQHVRRRFERFRETLADRLDADDLAVLDQLLDDAGPHAVVRREDVFVLSAATVHLAVAPAR